MCVCVCDTDRILDEKGVKNPLRVCVCLCVCGCVCVCVNVRVCVMWARVCKAIRDGEGEREGGANARVWWVKCTGQLSTLAITSSPSSILPLIHHPPLSHSLRQSALQQVRDESNHKLRRQHLLYSWDVFPSHNITHSQPLCWIWWIFFYSRYGNIHPFLLFHRMWTFTYHTQ